MLQACMLVWPNLGLGLINSSNTKRLTQASIQFKNLKLIFIFQNFECSYKTENKNYMCMYFTKCKFFFLIKMDLVLISNEVVTFDRDVGIEISNRRL